MTLPTKVRWTLGLGLATLLVVVPYLWYRWEYNRTKRLRVVTPGKVYRSGQMTAAGFADAVTRFRIRTVINLQDEYPDPEIRQSSFGWGTVKESQLCEQLNVRYVHLPPDLIPRRLIPAQRPVAIDRLLAILDDPSHYPVLIHCRAGLHRTGVLTAVYRMEYQGWSPREALREVKANGFGDSACTSANDYIKQYVLTYRRGLRQIADGRLQIAD